MRTEFEIPSGRTAALVDGDGERGVVLMVPGYTGSKEDFQPILKPLAEQGFRAVAVDQRGQYRSAWGAGPDAYRLTALTRDVLDLAALLDGGPIHLVGHSFRGLVCRDAVIGSPSTFASLVLMSSGPAAVGGERRQLLRAAYAALSADRAEDAWDLLLPRHRSATADPLWQAGHERFLARRFQSNDPLGLLVMAEEVFQAPDRSADLARTGVSTLVLFGSEDDSWLPAEQRAMAAALGADTVEIAGVGHAPATGDPASCVTALVGFYASLTAQGSSSEPSPSHGARASEAR